MRMRVLPNKEVGKKLVLDLYDKKILYNISQNCRTPYNQIAKKVGLSRDSIRYRIQRMTNHNIIQGYRTLVDIKKLNYINVHVFLQLNQPDKIEEQRLIEIFKNYSFVRAIIKFNGKYDFELAIIAKSIEELDNNVSQIISDCGKSLQHYELLLITKSFVGKTFPDNFIKIKPSSITKTPNKKILPPSVDEKDLKLLSTISNKGDAPLHSIAKEVGYSADAVKYRMKKLKESGVIMTYVPVINYNALNYNVYAILLSIANFTPEKEATLKEFINTNEDILWGVKTFGKYNVLLYVCTNNPDDLIKTTSDLRNYFIGDVRDYETLINYEEYKYTYFPIKYK